MGGKHRMGWKADRNREIEMGGTGVIECEKYGNWR